MSPEICEYHSKLHEIEMSGLIFQCFATTQMSKRPVLTTVTSAPFTLFARIIPVGFVAVVLLATKEMADSV